MALDQTQNFINVKISGTHTNTDTTIQLESGEASELPDPANGEYNLVWFNEEEKAPDLDPEVEIVRVTGVDTSNDTVTVQRGQEGTTAVDHNTTGAVYRFILSPTAKLVNDVDAANFATNSVTVSAGNGLANGGTVALGGSTTLNVATNGIGTDELDESAGFDFSSAISFTGGIDGGGSAMTVGDDFKLGDTHAILNLNRGELSGSSGIEWGLESSVSAEAGKATVHIGDDTQSDIEWQRNANVPTAFRVLDRTNVTVLLDVNDSGTLDVPQGGANLSGNLNLNNNNIDDVASIDGGGNAVQFNDVISSLNQTPAIRLEHNSSSPIIRFVDGQDSDEWDFLFNRSSDLMTLAYNKTRHFDLKSNGNFNLKTSGSIEDVGTPAIQFDGSANVTIPNGNLDLNGNAIISSGSTWLNVNNNLSVRPGGSGAELQVNQDSTNDDVYLNTAGTGNTERFKVAVNKAFSDGVAAEFTVTPSQVGILSEQTQPGSSSSPAIKIGNAGAGFYINSSGEIVAVDEAGNTTVIS